MSCLFNSLSYFIPESSYDIRQKICDYLEKNNEIIDGLETNFILNLENPNYIRDMRKTSTWGGANEIQTACILWKLQIIVKNYRNRGNKDIEFLPLNGDYERTIKIYWTGGHFEPIRE
jgi:hypothetical protein